MKAVIKLGEDIFEVDYEPEEKAVVMKMYSLWLNSIASSANDALKLDGLVQRLRKQQGALSSVVSAVGGSTNPGNPVQPADNGEGA